MKIRIGGRKNSIHFLEKKTFSFSFRRKKKKKRLWPTIFHDSKNFVIIIDGYGKCRASRVSEKTMEREENFVCIYAFFYMLMINTREKSLKNK
jgi:hypothetical protein